MRVFSCGFFHVIKARHTVSQLLSHLSPKICIHLYNKVTADVPQINFLLYTYIAHKYSTSVLGCLDLKNSVKQKKTIQKNEFTRTHPHPCLLV